MVLYIFSLVIIAFFIWLPVEIFFQDRLNLFGEWKIFITPVVASFLSSYIALVLTSSSIIKWKSWSYLIISILMATFIWLSIKTFLFESLSFFQTWFEFFKSVCLGVILFILTPLFIKLFDIIFVNVHDSFLTDCAKWKWSSVILSLRNDKIYVGILLKYPTNPRSRHESQTISIIPLISGGRNKDTKEVKWGKFYPEDDSHDYVMIVPRNEIVTFGKFSENIFKYFYNNNFK